MNNRSKDMIDAHFSLTITLNPFIICTFRHNSHIKRIWVQWSSVQHFRFPTYSEGMSTYYLIIRCLLIFLAMVSSPFCCRKFQICLKILPEEKMALLWMYKFVLCFSGHSFDEAGYNLKLHWTFLPNYFVTSSFLFHYSSVWP